MKTSKPLSQITRLAISTAIALTTSMTTAHAGNEKGNGGDWYGFHYSNIARQIADRIDRIAKLEETFVDPKSFRESVRTTSVISLPRIVHEARERDALTYSKASPIRTEVSRKRWILSNHADHLRLQLHEYFVAMGLEDSDQYELSMNQAEQIERHMDAGRISAIDYEKFSPQSRAQEVQDAILYAMVNDRFGITCRAFGQGMSPDNDQALEMVQVRVDAYRPTPGKLPLLSTDTVLNFYRQSERMSFIELGMWRGQNRKEEIIRLLKENLFAIEIDPQTFLPVVSLDYGRVPSTNHDFVSRSGGLKLRTEDGKNWKGTYQAQFWTDSSGKFRGDPTTLTARCTLSSN